MKYLSPTQPVKHFFLCSHTHTNTCVWVHTYMHTFPHAHTLPSIHTHTPLYKMFSHPSIPHQLKRDAEVVSEVEVINHVNDVVLVLTVLEENVAMSIPTMVQTHNKTHIHVHTTPTHIHVHTTPTHIHVHTTPTHIHLDTDTHTYTNIHTTHTTQTHIPQTRIPHRHAYHTDTHTHTCTHTHTPSSSGSLGSSLLPGPGGGTFSCF